MAVAAVAVLTCCSCCSCSNVLVRELLLLGGIAGFVDIIVGRLL